MNNTKFILPLLIGLLFLAGCSNTNIVDTNVNVPDNNWTYAKSIKTTVEIKDTIQSYTLYFKLRHTTDYRYANLYVVMRLKGNGLNKSTRYQFKLARNDGEWLGKGSGNLYTYNFPLLTNYHFVKSGKYDIEIEQNMRDNPLIGISDIGITLAKEQD
ncbi:MAG: gliding motility lipoprotein GldH [Pedobacter sp.]|uniref:gliding motility lipoprotein GldH n=1 Tax=Pedobacter sp. TaxID=1411316 RepID=UPI0035643B5A